MGRCKNCQTEIDDNANECAYCGYDPRANGQVARALFVFVGALLTMTIVGAVIGIPMIAVAVYGHNKSKGLKPTTHDPA